ncbi:MAG TPA: BPSS1780 family membrane protein [Burkholderiaceae bacterium]
MDSDHGVQWWSSAWRLLFHRSAAGVWIGTCLIALLMYFVLHVFELLVHIVANIGVFVLAGGLMIAAHKTHEGTPPVFGDLFAGFGPTLSPLVIAGALLTVAMLVIEGAAFVAGVGSLIGAFYGALSGNLPLFAGLSLFTLLVALVALLLLVPIGMAAWLAPALITLQKQPPVEALKASFSACWANLGPLTVYGLLWIAFTIVSMFTLFLLLLVLGPPLLALSTYAAYSDLFEASTLTPGPSAAVAAEGS